MLEAIRHRCREGSGLTTVHILFEGLTLCRNMPLIPADWPDDHKWIRESQINEETAPLLCELCAAVRDGKMAAPKAMKRAKITVHIELETGETFEGEEEEIVLAAYSCEKQIRAAAELSVEGLTAKVRDTILGYVPKSDVASA